MREKILLIDFGHGGRDPLTGDYTTDPRTGKKFKHKNGGFHGGGWFYEGVSNRNFAREFIAQASRAGFLCVPVGHPSKDTTLMQRIKFANYYHKEMNSNSIFLSFHSNAFKQEHRGFQIYHHPNSRAGKKIASSIASEAEFVFLDYDSIWPFNSRKTANFAVLRATKMPAVLIENGFFDNEKDARLLMDPNFIFHVCAAILRGLNKI
jgi:N-acetylmuramoyl-L-alanine amidase